MTPAVRVAYPHVEMVDGVARIVGTRVSVCVVFSWHRARLPFEKLCKRYPAVAPAALLAALAFAYDNPEVINANLWSRPRVT